MAVTQVMPGIREWDTPLGWHVLEVHYTADPDKRDPGWRKRTQMALGLSDKDWEIEHEINWMIGAGDCYFDQKAIQRYEKVTGGAFYQGELVEDPHGEHFRVRTGGPVSIWKLPAWLKYKNRPRKLYYDRYCIGADPAEGLEKGDNSTAYVIDRVTFEQVASVCGKIEPYEFAKLLNLLGRFYCEPSLGAFEAAFLGVEANNHGHTVLNLLSMEFNYPNLYMQEVFNQKASPAKRLGWFTSYKTKPIIVDGMNQALKEGEFILHDRALLGEMLTFVKNDGKLGAAGSNKDDRVMSMAVALQMHRHLGAPREPGQEVGGWRARLKSESAKEGSWIAV